MKYLFYVFFLIVSCAKSEDEGSDNEVAFAPSVDDLVGGRWKTKCVGDGEKTFVTFNESDFVLEKFLYLDASCTEIGITVTTEQTYSLDENNLDSVLVTAVASLNNDSDVFDANDMGIWGYTDWEINVEKDIVGRRFRADAEVTFYEEQEFYDIVKISIRSIYFGNKAGETEDDRPSSYSPTPFVRE
jgi:hypothetical protein